MHEAEVRRVAQQAGRAAAREVLIGLGVDVDNPLRTQRQFHQLGEWVDACDTIKEKSLRVAIGVIVAGITGAALWYAKAIWRVFTH